MEKYIYNALIEYNFDQPAMLCSQVEWQGSVPRRDYPVMLVLYNGTTIGTIGGGAMEHQVINAARDLFPTETAVLRKFDLSATEAQGDASICGGWTAILIELFTPATQTFIRDAFTKEQVILLHISGENPAVIRRQIVNLDQNPGKFPDSVAKALQSNQSDGRPKSISIGDELFLIKYTKAQPVLHIFGAGHVAKSVAELAQFIELDYCIYDDRSDLASPERFPVALLIDTSQIHAVPTTAKLAENDFVLVATRGHRHDFQLMQWLLNQKIAYLGLMSSQRKWKILSKALFDYGFSESQLSAVHSPVGLDIGSETVPEIAVSVISEIINHLRRGERTKQSLSASKTNK
ncbi:MAG: XdhC family protein [Candidatus Marinimicrobia bacterium]|nr:XdhC family protein [Candidatus Neomarinimicrobiota bacterium]